MPPEAAVLTTAYTINLMAPAAGERFTMTGTAVRAGRTLEVCHGKAVADGAAALSAAMRATLTALYDRPGIQPLRRPFPRLGRRPRNRPAPLAGQGSAAAAGKPLNG